MSSITVTPASNVRRLDPRDLSRHQRRQLQRSKRFGDLAQDLAAEVFDGFGVEAAERHWYDLRHHSTNSKGEVKSTSQEVGDKYPEPGRFRLWREQHVSLVASDANGTAWYIFVVFVESAGEIWIRRMRPSTVTRIVNERGGWNRSGHHRYSQQHKIPWHVIMTW